MPRRREVRRFGRGPYLLSLRRDDTVLGDRLPVRRSGRRGGRGPAPSTPPVTLLAGDNGSGKSTLIEAIAEAMGFSDEGGSLERSGELPAVPRPVMGGGLVPVLSRTRPPTATSSGRRASSTSRASSTAMTCLRPASRCTGTPPLHEQSHGQSFLALAANRFAGEGSTARRARGRAVPHRRLALLSIGLARRARGAVRDRDALADPARVPAGRLYTLDDAGVAECEYDDLEVVRLMRAFLEAPDRFIRAALADPDE